MTRSRPGPRPGAEASIDVELIWALVDAAPDALVVIDDAGVIELINRRSEELFGYHRNDLVGRAVEVLVPAAVEARHRAHRTRYRADPVPRPMGAVGTSLWGRRADGTEFPVEISLSPVSVGGNQRIVAAVRDVSNRLVAERHSRAIRHAIDTAVDGVFIADEKTLEFTYVNQCGAEMHGYAVDEMIGMTPLHLAPNLTEREVTNAIEPLVTGALDAVTLRTVALRKDGNEFPVEIHVNHPPGPDHDEASRPFVALVRDISDRVRAEQEMADIRTAAELAHERDRLAKDLHDRVIGDLFGVGLKMQAAASTITDEQSAKRVQESVAAIDDIIGLIRATIFDLKTDTAEVGVRRHLTQHVSSFRERLDYEPSLTITGAIDDIPDDLLDEVDVVIGEAITNIVKHASATTTEIVVSVDDCRLDITVSDNGVGLRRHRPQPDGGFGVNNLKSRAEARDGYCSIESSTDGGTTLVWSVPVTGEV